MNRHILSSAFVACLSLLGSAHAAGTAAQPFTVSATVSTLCVSRTAGTPNISMTYVPFGAQVVSTPLDISYRCSLGLAVTGATLDTASGSIRGVNYSLAVGTAVTVASTSGDAGTSGNYKTVTYPVTATMVAGQAGNDAVTAAPQNHILTLAF